MEWHDMNGGVISYFNFKFVNVWRRSVGIRGHIGSCIKRSLFSWVRYGRLKLATNRRIEILGAFISMFTFTFWLRFVWGWLWELGREALNMLDVGFLNGVTMLNKSGNLSCENIGSNDTNAELGEVGGYWCSFLTCWSRLITSSGILRVGSNPHNSLECPRGTILIV